MVCHINKLLVLRPSQASLEPIHKLRGGGQLGSLNLGPIRWHGTRLFGLR